jgi:transposase-like protein
MRDVARIFGVSRNTSADWLKKATSRNPHNQEQRGELLQDRYN